MAEIPIKSVRRVFEILDLFDRERRPLAAKEIAEKLEYPLMSSHELMKSMHFVGYADYDDSSRTYSPSRNLLDVLDWVREFLDRESDILDLLAHLNRQSKETVNLSRRSNAFVKILHGHDTTHAVGVSTKPGIEMPATQSLTGIVTLACLDNKSLDSFARRLERAHPIMFKSFDRDVILRAQKELKAEKSVAGYDLFVEGIGAVCTPVTAKTTGETLVIGIVGPSERVKSNEAEHRSLFERALKKYNVEIPKFS